MSDSSPNSGEVKLLPGADPQTQVTVVREPPPAAVTSAPPQRQLSELPKDELNHLAEEFGLDSTQFKTRQDLVTAIHSRRQLIASMNRDAMLDVVRWGRRPITANASKEQIAQEIARVRSMRFAGLSQRGLIVLGKMRDLEIAENEPVPSLVRKLKRKEGFFHKLNRKRRAVLGGMVASMIGETESAADYQFLPAETTSPDVVPPRTSTIKEDIEESGLIGGITNRLKKNADAYLNQKLDEVEARIDRKLDEIDRRLAEWRDKEIANRIKILKITLWASVVVGAFSLIYSYVTVVLFPHTPSHAPAPHAQPALHQPSHKG